MIEALFHSERVVTYWSSFTSLYLLGNCIWVALPGVYEGPMLNENFSEFLIQKPFDGHVCVFRVTPRVPLICKTTQLSKSIDATCK